MKCYKTTTIILLLAVVAFAQNKKIYGQFLGKGITIHQYSKVYKVPFNPQKSTTSNALLNVAWLGGRK